jgi:hypothetical protein
MKIILFCCVTSYKLVEMYECFGGKIASIFRVQDKKLYYFTLKMKAAGSSETLVLVLRLRVVISQGTVITTRY